MNLPTLLTVLRVLLIPVFVVLYLTGFEWRFLACTAIFAIAAITDWLDGYLARRLNQATAFGAFLDPVADKLMVAAALVVLAGGYASPWLTLPAVIIVGREIMISALREWMAEVNRRGVVKVSWIGKAKTTCQITSILLLLVTDPRSGSVLSIAGLVTIQAAAVLTLWSMVLYLQAAWPTLQAGARQGRS